MPSPVPRPARNRESARGVPSVAVSAPVRSSTKAMATATAAGSRAMESTTGYHVPPTTHETGKAANMTGTKHPMARSRGRRP